MIAEALYTEAEDLDIDVVNVAELINYFQSHLKGINFKVAVNHNLVDSNYILNNNDEVALLPPFAGG